MQMHRSVWKCECQELTTYCTYLHMDGYGGKKKDACVCRGSWLGWCLARCLGTGKREHGPPRDFWPGPRDLSSKLIVIVRRSELGIGRDPRTSWSMHNVRVLQLEKEQVITNYLSCWVDSSCWSLDLVRLRTKLTRHAWSKLPQCTEDVQCTWSHRPVDVHASGSASCYMVPVYLQL
jgi:hypothetical protein